MKIFKTLFLLLFISLTHAARVDIHLGKLRPNHQKIILEKILPELKIPQGLDVHLIRESTTSLVYDSLKNSQTVGLVWINDPHLVFDGEELLGGHLVGIDGRHLPKSIFSAAHPDFQFILPLTCHQSGFLHTYDPGPRVPFITDAENMRLADGDVRFDLKSLMTLGPQIQAQLDKIQSHHPTSASPKVFVEIEMEVFDLKSSQFDYVVTINQKFFASLSPSISKLGIIQAHQKVSLQGWIDAEEKQFEIEIFPDDYLRKRGKIKNVLDDILIKNLQISLANKIVYEKDILHLGDDETNIDKNIFLHVDGDHRRLMEQTPVQTKWSVTLSLD